MKTAIEKRTNIIIDINREDLLDILRKNKKYKSIPKDACISIVDDLETDAVGAGIRIEYSTRNR